MGVSLITCCIALVVHFLLFYGSVEPCTNGSNQHPTTLFAGNFIYTMKLKPNFSNELGHILVTSPNNEFFLAITSCRLVVAHNDTNDVHTIVWHVEFSTCSMMGDQITITFLHIGDLVVLLSRNISSKEDIPYQEKQIVWSTNTSGKGVKNLRLNENGNFVLYNSRKVPIWESFNHPSSVILTSQVLEQGMSISLLQGLLNFSLVVEPNRIVLYAIDPSIQDPMPYWELLPNSTLDVIVAYASLDRMGSLQLFDSNSNPLVTYNAKNSNGMDNDRGRKLLVKFGVIDKGAERRVKAKETKEISMDIDTITSFNNNGKMMAKINHDDNRNLTINTQTSVQGCGIVMAHSHARGTFSQGINKGSVNQVTHETIGQVGELSEGVFNNEFRLEEKIEIHVGGHTRFRRGIKEVSEVQNISRSLWRTEITKVGNVETYEWTRGVGWKLKGKAIRNVCELPNACRRYSTCHGESESCKCMEPFVERNGECEMSPNIGMVLENWCATTSSFDHFFVELKNTTTFFATKVGVRSKYIATLTECHSICLHNCSCFAFIFHKSSLACIPVFHPQSQFITTSSSLNFVATQNDHSSVFIKLTTSLSPSSQGVSGIVIITAWLLILLGS